MGNKPMKVLMVHNYYQSSSPSGEDGVFRNEVELLRKNRVDVVTYEKHNDEIKDYGREGKFLLPFRNMWSRKTYGELKQLLKKEKPDIAHFHNIFYLISPSAYYACREAGVPVVQTLHNFRFFCINGLLLRDGKVCEECLGKSPWKGVKYACYRDSQIYSFPIALADAIHRLFGTWGNKIDAFIALTEFGKKKFIECGLPEEKIFVKPNFLPDPPLAKYSHKGYAVFVGRISIEKGINLLINAFNMLRLNSINQLSLKIIGDGPLKDNYEDIVQTGKINNIEFIGRKSFDETMELLRNAQFMVMPSIWYEGFPMVIREAYACGKPVIASRLGAMAELVEDGKTGLLFEPGNPVDLAEKIKWMIEHETECIEMGKNARKVFEEKYTAERNFQILMNIYKQVLNPTSTYTSEV
jgi:glycosyltransferase involved in cell wall biosynthesis